MNTTKVKILSMAVIIESDLSKQEKLELLDFAKSVEDLGILKSVLESYGILDENYQEDEEDEDIEECHQPLSLRDLDESYEEEDDEDLEETLMGPLKTPRDEDIQETMMGPLKNPHDEDIRESSMTPLKNPHDEDLLEMTIPLILEKKAKKYGMTSGVYNWMKSKRSDSTMKTPSASQYVKPGLKTRLSQSLVRIRSPLPALP